MANAYEKYRKLTKLGKGSYYVVIPPEIIRALGWRERQKLIVQKRGKGILINDWKGK